MNLIRSVWHGNFWSQDNVVAALAATSLGAIWVSAAADFGADGVIERFEQVKPKLLFSIDATMYVHATLTVPM